MIINYSMRFSCEIFSLSYYFMWISQKSVTIKLKNTYLQKEIGKTGDICYVTL